MLARLRRWLPVLYGTAFTAVLAYLTLKASYINSGVWGTLLSRSLWDWQSPLPAAVVQAVGIVALVVILSGLVARVDRGFRPRDLVLANLNFHFLFRRWLRWPFAALLLWNLPVLAMLEEFIFRHGFGMWPTHGAGDVFVRSVGFGLVHAVASLNLRGGITQAVLGFWFSYQYLGGGQDPLADASMAHFLVDFVALTPVIIGILAGRARVSSP